MQPKSHYLITRHCVRRCFLCGRDEATGKSYDHRRDWILDRLELLTSVFAIEVLASAVLSTHYHLVLKLQPERSVIWNPREVRSRWNRLYGSSAPARVSCNEDQLAIRCTRLTDLGWFQRQLNEHIARRANAEDGCGGMFWEARARRYEIADEEILAACIEYVALTPGKTLPAQLRKRAGRGSTRPDPVD